MSIELSVGEKLLCVFVLLMAIPISIAWCKWENYQHKKKYQARTGRDYDTDFARHTQR